MPPKDIPSYVRWVMDQRAELKDTPEDIKKEMRIQLEDRLETLVNSALLAELPPDQLEHFDSLLAHGTEQQVQDFIDQNVPNKEEVVARVLVGFRNEYVGE